MSRTRPAPDDELVFGSTLMPPAAGHMTGVLLSIVPLDIPPTSPVLLTAIPKLPGFGPVLPLEGSCSMDSTCQRPWASARNVHRTAWDGLCEVGPSEWPETRTSPDASGSLMSVAQPKLSVPGKPKRSPAQVPVASRYQMTGVPVLPVTAASPAIMRASLIA